MHLLAGLFAHNLACELQMATTPPARHTTPNRAALWTFEKLNTLRNTLLHRAGRFTRPQRALTLTLNANPFARQKILNLLQTLRNTQHAA